MCVLHVYVCVRECVCGCVVVATAPPGIVVPTFADGMNFGQSPTTTGSPTPATVRCRECRVFVGDIVTNRMMQTAPPETLGAMWSGVTPNVKTCVQLCVEYCRPQVRVGT
jgi:hypothetical protein